MIPEGNLDNLNWNSIIRSPETVNCRTNSVLERYRRMASMDILRRPQNMVACSTGLSSIIAQPNRIVLSQNQYGTTNNGSMISTGPNAGNIPNIVEITATASDAASLPMRSRLTNCCVHFYQSVDCTAACYFVIAIVMMIVGVVVTLATAKEKLVNDEAGTIAQLWIVGPIFVSSGLLVLIKSASHVYKKMRRSMRHQLSSESRHSLRGTAAFPPSYSRALVAPVPSNIVEVDDDPITCSITKDVAVGGDSALTVAEDDQGGCAGSIQDGDSCKNVMIVCNDEPLPPSYTEAVEMIKRKSTTSSIGRLNSTSGSVSSAGRPPPTPSSKPYDVKDAATQIDLDESTAIIVVHQANDNAVQTNSVGAEAAAALIFNPCVVSASAATAVTQVVRKTRSDTNVAMDAKSFSSEPNVVLTSQQKNATGANEPASTTIDAGNSLVHM